MTKDTQIEWLKSKSFYVEHYDAPVIYLDHVRAAIDAMQPDQTLMDEMAEACANIDYHEDLLTQVTTGADFSPEEKMMQLGNLLQAVSDMRPILAKHRKAKGE